MEQNPDTTESVEATDLPASQPATQAEAQQPSLNAEKLKDLMTRLQAKENLLLGVIGGVVSALVGAAIWAGITVATEYQIGWMAVGVGFLCGYAVRITGKGISNHFGIIGAACALVGCLLGNFLTIVGFIAKEFSVGFFEVLTQMDYSLVPEIMGETFEPIDLLFYGIAVYGGYKASFHQLTEEDLQQAMD